MHQSISNTDVFTASSEVVNRPGELRESWGDFVGRRDESWTHLGLSGAERHISLAPPTQLRDRLDGRCLPFYETEADLSVIRGEARVVAAIAPCAIGALDSLCNYVIGQGFSITAQCDESNATVVEAQPLVQEVQRVLNEFLDFNHFVSDLDREIHNVSREDGEAFLALKLTRTGKIKVVRLDSEQIREPADTRQLEDWLGCGDEFVSSWSFGIHTRADEPDEPLGYHVLFDEQGINWEYIPAELLVHLKRNVPRQAKRGVSDFFPVIKDIEREAKIRRNTAEGVALQSAIAWIREHAEGTTVSGAQQVVDSASVAQLQASPVSPPRSRSVLRYQPGTILDVSPGMKYHPGPLGSNHAPNFILVAQYVLRSIGIRWLMPEYMISGDASNANYASTLVAESPFVKSREADQRFYAGYFHELLWKVVRLAFSTGRFQRFGLSYEELERRIIIQVDPPAVATRDELKQAQRQEILIRLGILSKRTAAIQNGLDYDQELQNGMLHPEE